MEDGILRTLKYAILGLISRKEMSGYDIAREFNAELANFWHAKHSQIYPELKKLTEEGLIEFDVKISGEVLEKKVYRLTPDGAAAFREWLVKDEELEPTPKDVFRLRMYFSNGMQAAECKKLIKAHLARRLRKLAYLIKCSEPYQEAVPNFHSDRFGDYIVLEGAIMRERSSIDWLEECLRLIDSVQA